MNSSLNVGVESSVDHARVPGVMPLGLDLLTELSSRVGKTYVTLGQRKPFELLAVDRSSILVRPAATNTVRTFSLKHVQAAFDHLVSHGSITIRGIRTYSEMNPVYIAALLGDLPGITVSTRPIALRVSPDPSSQCK